MALRWSGAERRGVAGDGAGRSVRDFRWPPDSGLASRSAAAGLAPPYAGRHSPTTHATPAGRPRLALTGRPRLPCTFISFPPLIPAPAEMNSGVALLEKNPLAPVVIAVPILEPVLRNRD